MHCGLAQKQSCVGQAAGEIFFSIVYVRGEDLVALLKRVGQSPSEKVVEIGCHLCDGVAAPTHAACFIAISSRRTCWLTDRCGADVYVPLRQMAQQEVFAASVSPAHPDLPEPLWLTAPWVESLGTRSELNDRSSLKGIAQAR